MAKKFLIVILILSLLGMIDSGYAVYQHYQTSGEAMCNVSETINCDVVNHSVYSDISGVPVAGIGLAGYIFFALICFLLFAGIDFKGFAVPTMLVAALFSIVYSAGLTFIEVYELEAVCPMCIISLVLVTGITITAFAGALRSRRDKP